MTLEGPSSREIRSKHGSDRENEIYIYIGIVDNLPYISWDKYNICIIYVLNIHILYYNTYIIYIYNVYLLFYIWLCINKRVWNVPR